jgi:hypothetical protein
MQAACTPPRYITALHYCATLLRVHITHCTLQGPVTAALTPPSMASSSPPPPPQRVRAPRRAAPPAGEQAAAVEAAGAVAVASLVLATPGSLAQCPSEEACPAAGLMCQCFFKVTAAAKMAAVAASLASGGGGASGACLWSPDADKQPAADC